MRKLSFRKEDIERHHIVYHISTYYYTKFTTIKLLYIMFVANLIEINYGCDEGMFNYL